MKTTHWARSAAAAVLLAQAAPMTSSAQAVDPWKIVPAPATSCFAEDGYLDKLDAARNALQAEIEKQTKVNAAAKEAFDNMDMSEKARRMQAFMMKDPQAAMKMMQAEQAAGTNITSLVTDADGSARRLDEELKRHQASFRTTTEQAVKPAQVRQKQLIDTKAVLVGEAQISMFTSAADHAQYGQLIAQENADYEKACAPYFGADGAFHKWLSSYRTEVIEKLAASDPNNVMVTQMAVMELPGGGYRSTMPLQQAQNYLQQARNVYEIRRKKAVGTVELRK
jgi:hypothetical protein